MKAFSHSIVKFINKLGSLLEHSVLRKDSRQCCYFLLRSSGFSLCRKGDLESSGDLEHMLDICYPERMNRILVVNISPVFDILYKLFKPFLPTATKQKVVILKNYSELLKYIDEDQLPVCYGGTKGLFQWKV